MNKPAVQRQSRPLLTVKATRRGPNEADGRSEFVYGSFARTVTLPAGADEDLQAELTAPDQQEQPVG